MESTPRIATPHDLHLLLTCSVCTARALAVSRRLWQNSHLKCLLFWWRIKAPSSCQDRARIKDNHRPHLSQRYACVPCSAHHASVGACSPSNTQSTTAASSRSAEHVPASDAKHGAFQQALKLDHSTMVFTCCLHTPYLEFPIAKIAPRLLFLLCASPLLYHHATLQVDNILLQQRHQYNDIRLSNMFNGALIAVIDANIKLCARSRSGSGHVGQPPLRHLLASASGGAYAGGTLAFEATTLVALPVPGRGYESIVHGCMPMPRAGRRRTFVGVQGCRVQDAPSSVCGQRCCCGCSRSPVEVNFNMSTAAARGHEITR